MPFHAAALLAERGFGATLAAAMRDRPDLVILQQPAWLPPEDIPSDTKVVVFLRSLACYGVGEASPFPWRRALSRPFGAVRFRANRGLLQRADLIISNSAFLQDEVVRRRGISTEVVPPFIDTDSHRTARSGEPGDRIVFVGLDEWKGAELALRVARAMPERRFHFLDGGRPSQRMMAEAERLPNVSREPWTEDVPRVLRGARLLLVPSLWEEPFGRLPVEAGSQGIPTLASAQGGLPESVGAGGMIIDALGDVEPWIRGIRLLDDPVRYAELSEAASAHAAGYSLEATLGRFVDLVDRHLGVAL